MKAFPEQMNLNLEAFSSNDFNSKVWINDVFAYRNNNENKEATALGLVAKLQLFIQEMNSSLEKIIESVPRVVVNLKYLQQEIMLINNEINKAKNEISERSQEVNKTVDCISAIHSIKLQFLNKVKSLKESDNWSLLSQKLEELFESGQLGSVSERLKLLQESLTVMLHSHDYENKLAKLEEYKNRLETLSTPKLIHSLKFHLAVLFYEMGRSEQFMSYLYNFEKHELLDKWKLNVETRSNHTLSEWLNIFFQELISYGKNLVKWYEKIINISGDIFFKELLQIFLNEVNVELEYILIAGCKLHSRPIDYLKNLSDSFKKFIECLENDFEAFTKDASSFITILQPLWPLIIRYSEFEQQNLNQQIFLEACNEQEDIEEKIHYLSKKLLIFCTSIKESIKRCGELTYGIGYLDYQDMLQVLVIQIFNEVRKVSQEFEKHHHQLNDWILIQLSFMLMHEMAEFQNLLLEIDAIFKASCKKLAPFINERYISNLNVLKLYDNQFFSLKKMLAKIEQNNFSCFENIQDQLNAFFKEVLQLSFECLMTPVVQQLKNLPNILTCDLDLINKMDMPNFKYPPQEYITKIGQYIMTMPQLLEIIVHDETSYIQVFLKSTNFFCLDVENISEFSSSHLMLSCVAKNVCYLYFQKIIKISDLEITCAAQLLADIDYLKNILEDLELELSPELTAYSIALKKKYDQSRNSTFTLSIIDDKL